MLRRPAVSAAGRASQSTDDYYIGYIFNSKEIV